MGLAIVSHLVLLGLKLALPKAKPSVPRVISVQLHVPPDKPPLIRPPASEPQQPQTPTPPSPIVQQAIQAPPEQEKPPANLSINSKIFARFLRDELERDTQAKPNAAEQFADTFVPYFNAKPVPANTVYAQGQLGGGQYKVRKNGKVYCVLKLVPLSFDDIVGGGFPMMSRDCTPPQIFDPKLRQNTLQWRSYYNAMS